MAPQIIYPYIIFIAMVGSFFLSSVLLYYIIKRENKKKIHQYIRDDISSIHAKKGNTPTCGGIALYVTTLVVFIAGGWLDHYSRSLFSVMLLASIFFAIGLLDDVFKIKEKDGKGLKAWTRVGVEFIASMIFLYLLNYQNSSSWYVKSLFLKELIYFGPLIIPFLILVIVGTANSVNLSDGLDGLATGLVLLAISPFLVIAIKQQNLGIILIIASLIGSLVAFMRYNFNPAKIFMGDCGSLFLGSLLGAVSIVLQSEFILAIAGGLFIIETMSVILQVTSYKLFKKRVFKMAPLHHSFELAGMNEKTIVISFYILGLSLAILSIIIGAII